MKYLYYNDNGELKMVSEKKLKAPNFSYIKKELTKGEKNKIFDIRYSKRIKNNKFIII